MKNTLSITTNCVCSCVDSVADGTNKIYIEINVGNVTTPTLTINSTTTNLTPNAINTVEVPTALFVASAAITFQYNDASYTEQIFTINFPASVTGSLLVTKTSDYVFTAKYTQSGGGSTINVIDNLTSTSATDALSANQGRVLNEGLTNCFQSVSNGKTLVAAAITDKGIDTEATDTFEQMAYNILAIPTGGDKDLEVLEYSAMPFIFVEHYTEVT